MTAPADAAPGGMAAGGPLLRVREVHKSYPSPQGQVRVLNGAGLTLGAGESLALMGESGSGKSTLLHLIAGLDVPDSGEILLEGRDVRVMDDAARAALRLNTLGLVFQQFNLIPSLTVAANLAFQARLAGRLDEGWQALLARRLELDGLLDRYPEQLSGGQQQRVAIGRALGPRPRLLLADEPTGNLDEATADLVLTLALELVEKTGCAFLMVTHSDRLARRLNRRVRLAGGRLA